jgi:osmotically-inducible protein OsmY
MAEDRSARRRNRVWAVLLLTIVGITAVSYLAYREHVDLRRAFDAARVGAEDVATTTRVKMALALSRRVSALDIDVDTERGLVRLSGEVPSEEARELAVRIAERTRGVASVRDQILVDPEAQPDPELEALRNRVADLEIETAIESRLRRHEDLKDLSITATVEDRRVVLSGTVSDPSLSLGAQRLAESVEGVERVENRIEATGETPALSDGSERLAKRVEFELFAADAFDLERIDVRVDDTGTATLAGVVRSQAEKLLAQRIAAEVEGVRKVVNELEVLTIPRRAELASVPRNLSPASSPVVAASDFELVHDQDRAALKRLASRASERREARDFTDESRLAILNAHLDLGGVQDRGSTELPFDSEAYALVFLAR